MGFRNGAYATVWKIERKEKYTSIQLSTSRKNRETGEYATDFSGYAHFVGKAHEDAAALNERDRIQIKECEVTSKYDREQEKKNVYFTVFGFAKADADKDAENPAAFLDDIDAEDAPFK